MVASTEAIWIRASHRRIQSVTAIKVIPEGLAPRQRRGSRPSTAAAALLGTARPLSLVVGLGGRRRRVVIEVAASDGAEVVEVDGREVCCVVLHGQSVVRTARHAMVLSWVPPGLCRGQCVGEGRHGRTIAAATGTRRSHPRARGSRLETAVVNHAYRWRRSGLVVDAPAAQGVAVDQLAQVAACHLRGARRLRHVVVILD